MSHATGEVIVGGKTVAWYLYDGTHDIAQSSLWSSGTQAWKHSRGDIESRCTCGQPPTEVLLYSGYGGGFYWPAEACLPCRALVSHPEPFGLPEGVERQDGYPLHLGGKLRAVARLKCVSEVPLGPIQSVRLGPDALNFVEEGPGCLRAEVRKLGRRQEIRVYANDLERVQAVLERAWVPGRR